MNIDELKRTIPQGEYREWFEKATRGEPQMFRVVMHNDDYTPMDFVVAVLEKFFNMDTALATQVMQQIHVLGKGVCGVFSRDVAETKVRSVMDYALMHEHPLLCCMEGV